MFVSSNDCIDRIQKLLSDWGTENFVVFPWRTTKNKFHALVAEILLQRTRAEQVVPVFELFSDWYPSIEDASREETGKIMSLLKPLGLEWRAKKILELIKELKLRKGRVPKTMVKLLMLPGVGTYAASAFLTFHVKQRALIVDSNSVRLWGRVFGFPTNAQTRRKKEFIEIIDRITPMKNHTEFNYAVLDHTRAICRPKPKCPICPINSLCCYYKK
jgi:A/G-specific adenine glycosylase